MVSVDYFLLDTARSVTGVALLAAKFEVARARSALVVREHVRRIVKRVCLHGPIFLHKVILLVEILIAARRIILHPIISHTPDFFFDRLYDLHVYLFNCLVVICHG